MEKAKIDKKIDDFLSQFKQNGKTLKETANDIGMAYSLFAAYVNGTRSVSYGNYLRLYAYAINGTKYSDSAKIKEKAIKKLLDMVNSRLSAGYTLLSIEDKTGVSHSSLYKYKKYMVNDVTLFNAIRLIKRLELDIDIPGFVEDGEEVE